MKKASYHKQYKTWEEFCKEDQQYALSCQKKFKLLRAIVRETPEMLSVTKILSVSTVKRLVVEQGRFLNRD